MHALEPPRLSYDMEQRPVDNDILTEFGAQHSQ